MGELMKNDPFDHPERRRPGEQKGYLVLEELPPVGPADYVEYPRPWALRWRGSGYLDIIAANGAYVANIFCWDTNEIEDFEKIITMINRKEEPVWQF